MKEDNFTTEEMIDEAERLEESGLAVEALEYWRSIVKRDPDPSLLCRYGSLAMELKEWLEAEQAFLSAVASEPNMALAYEWLGALYEEQGKFEVSLNYFNKSLEIEETARTFVSIGAIQVRFRLMEEARESFLNALTIDFNYEEAYYNLAMILKFERPTESIALLQKAVEIDPDYAIAHTELGWLLRGNDQYPEAEYHLRRAIELDDSDKWLYIYLGNLLWATDDLIAAEQAFKKAIETWPNGSPPYWCLALFYERQGCIQKAESLYKKALQIDPDDPEASLRFGMYLKEIGEHAKAKAHLERALNINPDDERIKEALFKLK